MKHFKKNAYIVAGQLFFFALFVWYFIHNSFLRSSTSTVTEFGLALVLVAAMAVNYWLIYPFFYKRYSFWFYSVVTLLETALVTFLEFHLTIKDTLLFLPPELMLSSESNVKYILYFNLFLRNICLMGFAGLMADNLGQKFRLLETDILMLKRKNQVLVQRNGKENLIIDASSICYVQQRQNYTKIFTIDGQEYEKRGSLNYFEKAPKELNGVKISRNTIVFMPYVQALNDKEVTVSTMQPPMTYTNLPLGKSIAPSAILEIERYLHRKANIKVTETDIHSENVADRASSATAGEENKSENTLTEQQEPKRLVRRKWESKKSLIIREYVSQHPDCNIKDIVSATNIPKSSLTRYLKELQARDLIEYVGSKKTGGYRVVEKKDDSPDL